MKFLRHCLLAAFAAATLPSAAAEILNIDLGWEFAIGRGKCKFAKTGPCGRHGVDVGGLDFAPVDLPHDWALALPFDRGDPADFGDFGYKKIGRAFPENSVAWYRKDIFIPKDWEGGQIALRFDGVFRDSKVWLNMAYLGGNESGYIGKTYDITDTADYGKTNSILVRVDASCSEGWWYEGAGIYRHVWLERRPPVHIPENGVYVRTLLNSESAQVIAEVETANASTDSHTGTLTAELRSPDGAVAGTRAVNLEIPAGKSIRTSLIIPLAAPQLWSPESPALYSLRINAAAGGTSDTATVAVGVRSAEFTADGFLLNGKRVQIKGACVHQDMGCVGVAVADALWEWRIRKLKEMGVNAVRTAHNPPAPEFLDACDRLGMMVMDETRGLMSTGPHLETFRKMILRDRNHPSVIIWSLGNEEGAIHATAAGERIAAKMLALQRRLDPSRASTYGGNGGGADGINALVDVRGVNYVRIGNAERAPCKWAIDDYRRRHPRQPVVGTEEASSLTTRGESESSRENGYMADADETENAFHCWSLTAEEWVNFYAARPWIAGGFFWTGFDYRGETTPWNWPTAVAHFGAMDLCGFPKHSYWLYRSWWRTDEDVLHISPDWDAAGKTPGRPVNVRVCTNARKVELFLNGKSLGERNVKPLSHASWSVPYTPGILEAEATFASGAKRRVRRETAGQAAALEFEISKARLTADGQDVWLVDVSARDALGRAAESAAELVSFSVSGPARIIGVGNGDNSSHEPEVCEPGQWRRRLFHGKAQVAIRTLTAPGKITLTATLGEKKFAISAESAAP